MTEAHPTVFRANAILALAVVLGLLFAIFMGVTIGESDIRTVLFVALGLGAVCFAIGLYRYAWHISLFVIFSNFIYRPFGFAFGSTEIACGLGVGVIALFIWQHRPHQSSELLSRPAFRFVQRLLFVWLAYVLLHMIYNIKVPHRPAEFALNNAIKSYFAFSMPYFLLFYFSRSSAGIVVRGNFFWRIAQICFAGLLLNLGLRLWEIYQGTEYVFIPVINAIDNLYTLRAVGPLAMLVGTAGLCVRNSVGHAPGRRLVLWLLVVLGAFGTLLSGGRAAILTGILFAGTVLLLRRRITPLLVLGAVGLLGVVLINVMSGWINTRGNPFLQRSVQWAMLEKSPEAEESIQSSSRWRGELFWLALEEWRSSPRIIFFGRATYGYGSADELARTRVGGYQALMQTSLRRGATHNLITDLLIAYGLVGCLIYLTLFLGIIRFLWKLRRARELSEPATTLTLVCLVAAIYSFGIGLVAGGIYPIEQVWFLIVLITAIRNGEGLAKDRRLDAPPPARPWQAPEARRPLPGSPPVLARTAFMQHQRPREGA